MSTTIKQVFRDWILGSTPITDLLASFDFGSGDEPAIFTSREIPEEASFPAVVITLVGGTAFGIRANKGGALEVDVDVFGERNDSGGVIDELGELIWDRLNHADMTTELATAGYFKWVVLADPPQDISDDDGFPGYRIRTVIKLMKE